MRLDNIAKSKSPERPHFTRLSADIFFEKNKKTQNYWIEFSSEYNHEIATDGNCWLILLSAMAALNGEDVTIQAAVDPYLLENVKALRREWRAWNKAWKITDFNCPNLVPMKRAGQKTGLFFSGGIDSFYSLLRNNSEPNDEGDATGTVTDLITVWGFEIDLSLQGEFERLNRHIKNAAEAFNKNHLVAITNIRAFNDDFANIWVPVGHSGSLGFVAYALQGRFKEVVIGSTVPYGTLKPCGTHSLTDTLMSSKVLRILHDGAIANRTKKVLRVAMSGKALENLHVCLRNDEGNDGTSRHFNCSACEKCVITMAALDLAGKKDIAPNFNWSNYSVNALSKKFIIHGPLYHMWKELRDSARATRPDIAKAISTAINNSRPFWILSKTEYWAKRKFPFILRNKEKFKKLKRTFYKTLGMRA